MSIILKTCTKCNHPLPLSDFHKRAGTKDGHAYMCRYCQSAYDQRPERKREKRETKRARYHSDPEYRELVKSRVKHEYHNNPIYQDATKRRVAIWQRENKERVNANARARYHAYYGPVDRARRMTPEYRKRKLEWERQRLSHPEAKQRQRWSLRQSKYRRRMWIADSDEHFTQEEWDTLCQKYNYRCLACGTSDNLSADHIVPLSRLGSNGIQNIQPLCRPCNSSKGTKIIDYRY